MTLPYPQIDPVMVHLGPFAIRWYALAYIAGIFIGWRYIAGLMKRPDLWGVKKAEQHAPLTGPQLEDIIFWVTLGVIVGGRLGYVLFYEPDLLVQPWVSFTDIFGLGEGVLRTLIGWIHLPPAIMLWKGGMSFHGGLLGVTVAGYFYSRRHALPALRVGDLFACAAPIGLFFGRIANFINGELWGRPTDVPWAMVFPSDPLQVPRHPSQLYEACLEGVVLFIILRIASHKFHALRRPGAAIGVFLAGYGAARILVENFRQPDIIQPHYPLGLTTGILLSTPMLALGAFLVWRAYRGGGAKAGKAAR